MYCLMLCIVLFFVAVVVIVCLVVSGLLLLCRVLLIDVVCGCSLFAFVVCCLLWLLVDVC